VSSSTLHRIIVSIYAVLSLAALGRSSFQIITKFDEAPLAYSLSALAAVVYVLATITVAMRHRPGAQRIAQVALTFELAGVLVVGAISLVIPELFPDQTVWSQFGLGYLFIPLVLPILGLWWLRKRAAL
jgi:cytochrome bd-type quinol oxidase subunit 2